MPHRPLHRGPAPEDQQLFGPRHLPRLQAAVSDLCWLLDRGYAAASALELVGNHYALTRRQRLAIGRVVCSAQAARRRQAHQVQPQSLRGEELWLDGYNVLTILETALAGGIVLVGRDGCCRDIAGVHRRYRKVQETVPALELIARLARSWRVACCHWWLDQPVSNSGRLKTLILQVAARTGPPTTVDLAFNPDSILAQTAHVVASSDGAVLDRCQRWVNLVRLAIAQHVPSARLVDLRPDPADNSAPPRLGASADS